jgi:hypothetical protein
MRGETNIIAVDNLTRAAKVASLVNREITDYLDKDEFLRRRRTATSVTKSRPSSIRVHAPIRSRPTAAT